MKRLLAVFPNIGDATSYWRGVGPLSKLYMDDWHIQFGASQVGWPDLIQYDALFVQRPADPVHVDLIQRAKSMGIPVWVDYDDNLYAVPVSNPAFQHYGRPEVQKTIAACVKMADLVTVSTKALQDCYRTDALVIPNAWNDYLFPLNDLKKQQKTVMWRGSPTHDEDVLSWADDLVEMYDEFPEYKWVFFGGCNWQLLERLKDSSRRVQMLSGTDPISYVKALEKIRPEWVIVPLKDNLFNQGKSNIAWLEATYAGAACLAPEWAEWNKFGVATYRESMYQTFKSSKDYAAALNDDSRIPIKREYVLSEVNALRRSLLRGLR
jgi:hypothetical protein